MASAPAKTTINDLPTELADEIMSYLDRLDYYFAKVSCRRLFNTRGSVRQALEKLENDPSAKFRVCLSQLRRELRTDLSELWRELRTGLFQLQRKLQRSRDAQLQSLKSQLESLKPQLESSLLEVLQANISAP